jgi:hypothetical protein
MNFPQALADYAGRRLKISITNSKNPKNARPSHEVVICDLAARKNSEEFVHMALLVATDQKSTVGTLNT